MERFKNWWNTSKLWQKVAIILGVLFLFNILLGACAGPRYGQTYSNGQPTIIYHNSNNDFLSTMGGFLGGYWVGSRNRELNNNTYNNSTSQPKNNQPEKNEYKPIEPQTKSTVTPEKKNEYKPIEPQTKSTVAPEKKNEYKPIEKPKTDVKPEKKNEYKPIEKPTPKPNNSYKPSGSQSKPNNTNQYNPK